MPSVRKGSAGMQARDPHHGHKKRRRATGLPDLPGKEKKKKHQQQRADRKKKTEHETVLRQPN